MSNFTAKVPMGMMHMTLTVQVRYQDLAQTQVESIETDKSSTRLHLNDAMQTWLDDTCVGNWELVPNDWSIRFEQQQDYVRYCFDWL